MIIDPILNCLDPTEHRIQDTSETLVAGANTTKPRDAANIRSPNMEEPPPPYSEIDLERGIIEFEGLEHPHRFSGQCFMGMGEGNTNVPSGMHHIKEGTQILYDSAVYFAETSLLALGTCLEGFGKILCGIGMIMKHHHTHCSIPDN